MADDDVIVPAPAALPQGGPDAPQNLPNLQDTRPDSPQGPLPLQPPSTSTEQREQREQDGGAVEAYAETTLDGAPRKGMRSRQRLLRGLSRISSSPTLAQLGRPRAHSSPYGATSSFSCVSLSSGSGSGSSSFAFGAQTPNSCLSHHPSSYLDGNGGSSASASGSVPGTPGVLPENSPLYDGIETRLATRPVDGAELAAQQQQQNATAALPAELRSKKTDFNIWANMPRELKIHIFSFLQPRELVRASRASRDFHKLCFDGQLWTRFDASEFYREIPADSLAKIIVAAGPFVQNLNLRGCVQVEHYKRAEVVVKACKNLVDATLEGCLNFQRGTLHSLLRSNERLERLNLTGLSAVTNATCKIVAEACPQLEMLNVSWCEHMDARGIRLVVERCPRLSDLRAGEVKGFDSREVAEAIFRTNNLTRLVLSGCSDLSDTALRTMIHGANPELDILTDRPLVPPRRLRHLDLSRCAHLTSHGVRALGHMVPHLEGLKLGGCTALTDAALEPVLASTPRLTHLELEDMPELTNAMLAEHLAKSPCAAGLRHLTVSYCENLGDPGMLPVIRACKALQVVEMDNTRVSDLVLLEAAAMVRARSARTKDRRRRPRTSLKLVVYDCQNVTWTGLREVLSRNTEVTTVVTPAKTQTQGQGQPQQQQQQPTLSQALRQLPPPQSWSDLTVADIVAAAAEAPSAPTPTTTTTPAAPAEVGATDDDRPLDSTAVTTASDRRPDTSRPDEPTLPPPPPPPQPTTTTPPPALAPATPPRSEKLYPTEIITLKCFYGWQMTVDEHTKRVLRGDLESASRLERKWAEYMQANEEAGAGGAGLRRRRRRAREAAMAHADEEDGGGAGGGGGGTGGGLGFGGGRRRARTAACVVM